MYDNGLMALLTGDDLEQVHAGGQRQGQGDVLPTFTKHTQRFQIKALAASRVNGHSCLRLALL